MLIYKSTKDDIPYALYLESLETYMYTTQFRQHGTNSGDYSILGPTFLTLNTDFIYLCSFHEDFRMIRKYLIAD